MKGPSWQSEAIRKRRGGSLGFPSVKKSCFPVCPTTKGAMGAAIFSKTGTPRRKGNCSKEPQVQSIVNKALLPRCAGEMKTLECVSNTDTRIGSKTPEICWEIEECNPHYLSIYLFLPSHTQMRASKCDEVNSFKASHFGFLMRLLEPRKLMAASLTLQFFEQDDIFITTNLRCIQHCNCIPCKQTPKWMGYKRYPFQTRSSIYNLLNLPNW